MNKLDLGLKKRDRLFLKDFLSHGEHQSREMVRASILMALDRGVDDAAVAQVLGTDRTTIWRTRKAYLDSGLQTALYDLPRPGRPRKYGSSAESVGKNR